MSTHWRHRYRLARRRADRLDRLAFWLFIGLIAATCAVAITRELAPTAEAAPWEQQ